MIFFEALFRIISIPAAGEAMGCQTIYWFGSEKRHAAHSAWFVSLLHRLCRIFENHRIIVIDALNRLACTMVKYIRIAIGYILPLLFGCRLAPGYRHRWFGLRLATRVIRTWPPSGGWSAIQDRRAPGARCPGR